jgi:valyl-tRNA synthetase
MSNELPKQYRPAEHEDRVFDRWMRAGAFHADPAPVLSGQRKPYCVLIPPPNVTAALHLGHALNNTLQDILVRAHRMMGYETLWMPGTDHAGIATQAVVERRIKKEEGLTRQQLGREKFVERVQAFKDEYEATITNQLKKMGCSCDWERQRFTMDEVCARAVREAFFRLFKDGLIYRGKRLVNWDPVLQTAIADDEIENIEIDGHFYYLRYPLVHADSKEDPQPVTWNELARRGYPGADTMPSEEQAYVTVATTRPETYLGDTAVAVNPKDPRATALRGLYVELPLVGRVIPIIEDDYVVMPSAKGPYGALLNLKETDEPEDPKAAFASGFLKVTPAHDPNDYELGIRHRLPMINVMAPDGSISDKHGWADVGDAHIFVGKKREEARKLVVKEFEARGWLEKVLPYRHTVGHSDRSKAPIEPYLSDQWYVRVTDPRLAQSANAALVPEQRTSSASNASSTSTEDTSLRFHPPRYAKTYETWHDNIRDWCISRQLWWGHRIPVWTVYPELPDSTGNIPDFVTEPEAYRTEVQRRLDRLAETMGSPGAFYIIEGNWDTGSKQFHICVRTLEAEPIWELVCRELNTTAITFTPGTKLPDSVICPKVEIQLAALDLKEAIANVVGQDPDVLDTWFSSALWPMSTMAWPDDTDLLRAFNPTSTLCTAREIITLWVSRMVMFNRYFRGQDLGQGAGAGPVPFRDVFIHSVIQDGEGRKMSKTLGNGVDPLDIIATHGADAMRFTLCHMTTQTQDVRMPVVRDPSTGKNTSPKFDLGRNFANKLWNAARFALGILNAAPAAPAPASATYPLVDRWMLSRLAAAVEACNAALRDFQFSDYATTLYDLLWRDFCDWYLEAIKPTVASDPRQRAVLAHTLDTILRLLHPVMPFVTEAIYEQVRDVRTDPVPGIKLEAPRKDNLLATAGWPEVDPSLRDESAEREFEHLRAFITAIREVRAQHNVQPRRKITLHLGASAASLGDLADSANPNHVLVSTLAGVGTITKAAPSGPSVAFTFDQAEYRLSDLAEAVDTGAERARLQKLIADLDKSIATLEARLANPGYAQKAPPHMVQQTKDQLEKAKAERSAAAATLAGLGG